MSNLDSRVNESIIEETLSDVGLPALYYITETQSTSERGVIAGRLLTRILAFVDEPTSSLVDP
ncbi:hypothetical protein OH492_13960 [Vibrio chagasii]|nr:hypothetical protein [Vibrio chagasii]